MNKFDFSTSEDRHVYENSCWHCGETNEITVNSVDFLRWQLGDYIQDAFPHLDADKRELVKTGFHPECWSEVFSD